MTRRLLALCALATACAPGAAPSARAGAAASALAADTARGVVEEVGAEPATSFVLRAPAGTTALAGDRALLASVAGVEVMVRGPRDARGTLRVDSLAVRAAAGAPAVDGVLARDGDQWVLVEPDGRRVPLPYLPEPLRTRAGARVWLAGPLDRPPEAYGVIAGRP